MSTASDSPLRVSASFVAFAAVAIAAGFGFGALFVSWPAHPPADFFTPEHVLMFEMLDNAAQRHAYELAVATLFVFPCLAWRCPPPTGHAAFLFGWARARLGLFVALVAVGLFGWLGAASWALPAQVFVLFFVACGLAFEAQRRPARYLLWLGALALVAFYQLPGFFTLLDLSEEKEAVRYMHLGLAEWHYSIVMAAGDRLAAGLRLYEQARPHYGLLVPGLLASYQRLAGPLSMGDHVQLIRWLQLGYCLLALLAYFWWRPREPLPALAMMALVVLSLSDEFILRHPNQSAVRFIGFPLAALLLLAVRSRSARASYAAVGAGCAGLVLLNPETGIALGAGMAGFLWVCHPPKSLRQAALLVGGLVGSALAAALAFAVFFRLGVGQWPLVSTHRFLAFALGGYGARPLAPNLAGLTLFLSTGFVAAKVTTRRLRAGRGLAFREGFLLAASVAVLAWGTYYVNRPDPDNLRGELFSFGFVAQEFFNRRTLRLAGKGVRFGVAPVALVALFIGLAPMAIGLHRNVVEERRQARRLLAEELSEVVSGVRVSSAVAQLLRAKAEYLRASADTHPMYLSSNSYTLPLLSGVHSGLPVANALAETIALDDFEKLIAAIVASPGRRLLFDEPQTYALYNLPLAQALEAFSQRVQSRLRPHFGFAERRDGWEIWERLK